MSSPAANHNLYVHSGYDEEAYFAGASSTGAVLSTSDQADSLPSYEIAAATHPPLPPRNDEIKVVHPVLNTPVVAGPFLVPATQDAYRPIGPSDGYTLIDEKSEPHSSRWSALWGTLLVALGLDLAWATFCFAYVLSTWLTAVCLMVLPIVGIPLYLIFAISWRALAQVDLILSTSLFPSESRLPPTVPLPPILFPRLRDHIQSAASIDALRGSPLPVFTKSRDATWHTARLTMLSSTTWTALVHFIITRFVLSMLVFLLFWTIIFPYWLLYGILCGGVVCTPKAVWAPMRGLMAPIPRLAVAMLSQKRF